MGCLRSIYLCLTLFLLISGHGSAATTWDNGLGTGIWSANGNWTANEPNALDVVTFGATGAGAITLGVNEAATDLNFTANGYSLNGGNLTIGWWILFFGGGGDINTNAGVTATIASQLGNATNAQLVKQGTGTLILSGANTFTTSMTVNNGVLNILSNTALGTTAAGTIVTTGAALELQGGITITGEALTLTGTGIANGGALRNISGNNHYNGNITLTGNTRVNSDAGLLTINPAAGNAFSGAFGLTLGGAGNILIQDSIATGTGTLTKVGGGIVTLQGANTFTGSTVISSGILIASGASTLGGTAAITVDSGGTLLLSGAGNRVNDSADITLNGGTLSMEGLSGASETMGSLTLTANSSINFGAVDSNTLTFDDLTLGAFTLAIYGWTGNIYSSSDTTDTGAATQDRLVFANSTLSNTLSQVIFFDDSGNYLGNGHQVSIGLNFEIVPVPEPQTIAGAIALLGFIGFRERRRLGVLLTTLRKITRM